ncbi:PREDICTED: Retrovirus-related Pol poly from transposon, partial [Prunus dulcis]
TSPSTPVLHSSTSFPNSSFPRSPAHDTQMLPVFTEAQLEVLLPFESASSLMDNSGPLPAQVHPANSMNNHPMQTRSKSGIVQSKKFPEFSSFHTHLTSISEPDTPSYFKQALGDPAWKQAMTEEIQALDQQGTWTLVPSPPNTNIVGCKWIFKIKKNADGTISRYKARLVAQGFSQEYGLDYEETFSPVVRHTTVRLILGLAVNFQWELRQLDVKNAFLHGELQEDVFMKQPQGFVDSQYPNHVCKLQKSLYGLKQAPRAWNAKFTGYLPTLGFSVSHSDPSLFVKKTEVAVVILLLYVDDIIITGSDPSLVTSVIQALSEVFELKDLGKLKYFLGLEVQYHSEGKIFVNQAKYARDLIKKASMETCKPCSTPSKPHHQVLKDEGTLLSSPTLFRSIVGALQYLTFTRPDIAFAVNTV